MTAKQRYEIIRPIICKEKTVKEVHNETDVPIPTLYRWLRRFNEGSREVSSLADKSSKPHHHPQWLTPQQRNQVVGYKLHHPQTTSRQIAKELSDNGLLEVSSKTVSNILNEHNLQYNPGLRSFFPSRRRVKPLYPFHHHLTTQKSQQIVAANQSHCYPRVCTMSRQRFSPNGLMIFRCC